MKKIHWLLAPLLIMMKCLVKLFTPKNQLAWISLNMDIGNNMKDFILGGLLGLVLAIVIFGTHYLRTGYVI